MQNGEKLLVTFRTKPPTLVRLNGDLFGGCGSRFKLLARRRGPTPYERSRVRIILTLGISLVGEVMISERIWILTPLN